MADLLVTSMMADGGLEAAFEASLLGKPDKTNLIRVIFIVCFYQIFQLKQMILRSTADAITTRY
jgi:hypothetical protein